MVSVYPKITKFIKLNRNDRIWKHNLVLFPNTDKYRIYLFLTWCRHYFYSGFRLRITKLQSKNWSLKKCYLHRLKIFLCGTFRIYSVLNATTSTVSLKSICTPMQLKKYSLKRAPTNVTSSIYVTLAAIHKSPQQTLFRFNIFSTLYLLFTMFFFIQLPIPFTRHPKKSLNI